MSSGFPQIQLRLGVLATKINTVHQLPTKSREKPDIKRNVFPGE